MASKLIAHDLKIKFFNVQYNFQYSMLNAQCSKLKAYSLKSDKVAVKIPLSLFLKIAFQFPL